MTRWSEEQLKQHQEDRAPKDMITQVKKKPRAYRSKTEAKYAELLEAQRLAGEIHSWKYEAVKFRLGLPGSRCWYTPDFMVVYAYDYVQFIEIKGGYIRETGKVKFKVACEAYPLFGWTMMQYKNGAWKEIMTG